MLPFAMNGEWHGVSLWLALCWLLFIASLRCEAQNLVPNASFEETDTCPYTIGFQEGDRPIYWRSWNESPEYFNACVPGVGVDSLIGVPLNGFGYQQAMDGDAYVGMYTYGSVGLNEPYREYVGCQLLEPLQVGETYFVSFRTSLAMGGSYYPTRWAANNIGMLFTMADNAWYGTTGPPFTVRNYAHVHASSIISDTASWTLVSGTFVADSAYQYMVLGNFFDDGLTDVLLMQSGVGDGAYYYIMQYVLLRDQEAVK